MRSVGLRNVAFSHTHAAATTTLSARQTATAWQRRVGWYGGVAAGCRCGVIAGGDGCRLMGMSGMGDGKQQTSRNVHQESRKVERKEEERGRERGGERERQRQSVLQRRVA